MRGTWLVVVLITACGTSASIDARIADTTSIDSPSFGACTNMPSQGIACTGTLANAATGSFTCMPIFAQFNSGMNQTTFLLSQQPITPPAGVTSLTLGSMFMTGQPTVGTAPLSAGDRVDVMTSVAFSAVVGGPGTLALTLSGAVPRTGGTPGDYCLHGHLAATLAGPGVNAIDMAVDF